MQVKFISKNAAKIASGAYLARHGRQLTTWSRFRDLTMVNRGPAVDNLRLVHQWRHVTGDIVECGSWRGGMSGAMAVTAPGHHHVLFDSFEGLPDAKAIDGDAALTWQRDIRDHDNCTADEASAHLAMERAGATDYSIAKGWFEETVPPWAAEGRPIAILRLDGDWYDSTILCLEHLFPLVSSGGGVIIDDYFTWDGCSRAVHDYLSAVSSDARIHRTPKGVAYIPR